MASDSLFRLALCAFALCAFALCAPLVSQEKMLASPPAIRFSSCCFPGVSLFPLLP